MAPETPRPAGFIPALRAFVDALLASAQQRIELVGIELQELRLGLILTFVWVSAALFAAMLVVTFASLTLVYLFWESARLAVLGGLLAFYAVALVAIIVALRRQLARLAKPFAATLDQLAKDRACIQPEN